MAEVQALTFVDFMTEVVGFKPTPAQRVWALVAIDGVPPGRLEGEERELARTIFGDIDEVPARALRVVEGVFGRGSGKDELGGLYGEWRMLTADISRCGPGDLPRFIVVAPDMKLATIAKLRALTWAKETPDIAKCIESENADGFILRRPHDGRQVAFEVLAATRAGSAVRGRSIIGALLSECAFFRGEDSAVNDKDVYQAITPRLTPGAQILMLSTPWSEQGLFWELFEKNRAKPTTALIAQASTLVMRDNDPQIAEDVARETENDPITAEREFGAQFVGTGGSMFFDPSSIAEAIDPDMAHPLKWPGDCGRGAAGDLGLKKDSSAIVVGFNQKDAVRVAHVDEMRPERGAPLAPSIVYTRWTTILRQHAVRDIFLDQHYIESAREVLGASGITVWLAPSGQQGKLECYLATKELLNEGKLRIPNHPRLIAQLKAVISKPQPGGGLRIEVPRRLGQAHGDIVSALVLTCWQLWKANANAPATDRHRERSRQIMEGLELSAFGHGPPPPQQVIDRAERIHMQMRWRPETTEETV